MPRGYSQAGALCISTPSFTCRASPSRYLPTSRGGVASYPRQAEGRTRRFFRRLAEHREQTCGGWPRHAPIRTYISGGQHLAMRTPATRMTRRLPTHRQLLPWRAVARSTAFRTWRRCTRPRCRGTRSSRDGALRLLLRAHAYHYLPTTHRSRVSRFWTRTVPGPGHYLIVTVYTHKARRVAFPLYPVRVDCWIYLHVVTPPHRLLAAIIRALLASCDLARSYAAKTLSPVTAYNNATTPARWTIGSTCWST